MASMHWFSPPRPAKRARAPLPLNYPLLEDYHFESHHLAFVLHKHTRARSGPRTYKPLRICNST